MQALVSVAELHAHADDPDWIVFDVRHDLMAPEAGEAAYRAGHIAGARFANLDRRLSGPKDGTNGRHPLPPREALAGFLMAQGVNARSTLVAYDASGGTYGARFWWLARWLGHERVAVLDGGLPAWLRAGLPLTMDLPLVSPGDFTARASLVTQVDSGDVEANLQTRRALVVDARAPERYRGEVEPLDRVAGHIPHAVNRPSTNNLNADGTFKPAAQLRDELMQSLAGRDAAAVIHSCGSGVTACHNLLAMEVAGLPGAALYPGSWSAWSSDPQRPVATGPT